MQKVLKLLKREKHKPARFLRDTKPNPKLWNEMLREIKDWPRPIKNAQANLRVLFNLRVVLEGRQANCVSL